MAESERSETCIESNNNENSVDFVTVGKAIPPVDEKEQQPQGTFRFDLHACNVSKPNEVEISLDFAGCTNTFVFRAADE